MKITARLVFGVILDMSSFSITATAVPSAAVKDDPLTLAPPSHLARRIPLVHHPSHARPDALNPKFRFRVRIAEDGEFVARNARKAATTRNSSLASTFNSSDSGILQWGAWCELSDPTDEIETSMIPFFADLMKNLPELLPQDQRPDPSYVFSFFLLSHKAAVYLTNSEITTVFGRWFATVVMSIEFKSKIPSFHSVKSSQFSPRTVGVYTEGRFMSEGRHDSFVEVWTSPANIGGSDRIDGLSNTDTSWRENQVCLAISHQMALTIPIAKNLRKAKGKPSDTSKESSKL